MTYEEALHEINTMVYRNTDDFSMTISKECYKMIIEALEKQIPKKPDSGYDIFYGEDAKLCPVCGDPNPNTYCGTCGQRLDWSDENETND